MAKHAEAAHYNGPLGSILLSVLLEMGRLCVCCSTATNFLARSSWLHSSPLPDDCYLFSHANIFLQLLYPLAVLEAVLSPVNTIAFIFTILRRDVTYTDDILIFGLIAICAVVAAVVLALQTLALKSSVNVQAILRIRPDLSSRDVLGAWGSFIGGKYPLAAFIFFLVTSGFQIATLSARHKRRPKQFRPFVLEKHKRMSAVGVPEASILGTELVAGLDSGPLARLYDDYEKQGLVSTHIDLDYFDRKDFTRAAREEGWMRGETRYRAFQEHRTEDGPQFSFIDRYWVNRVSISDFQVLILVSGMYFLLAVGFEIARFVSACRSNRSSQWLCNFGIFHPWPLAIWIVAVLISVQCRFALQCKVLGKIRINRLLTISFTISMLPGAAYALARVINNCNSDNEDASFPVWDFLNTIYSCFVTALMLSMELVAFFLGRTFVLL